MTNMSFQYGLNAPRIERPDEADIKLRIRNFIVENLLHGTPGDIDDAASLTVGGNIDSMGMLELVAFLSEEFAITLDHTDLIPANLDSINGMVGLVLRNLAAKR